MMAHLEKSGSLHRISTQNALQKYLLNKNKIQKTCVPRCTIHINKKKRESPVNCKEDQKSQEKSRIVHFEPQISDLCGQLEALKDHRLRKGDFPKQLDPHKKWKSNKSLLSILLNHFHQQRKKNQTLPDSESFSSYNLAPQSRSIHHMRIFPQSRPLSKQKSKGRLTRISKRSFQADSFHVKSTNMEVSRQQENVRNEKPVLSVNMENADVNNKTTMQKKTFLLNRCQKKHFTHLFERQDTIKREESMINIRKIQKENKKQRVSEKPKRIFFNTYCPQKEEGSVDPWSTNYIKGESEDLPVVENSLF